jgi:hypothetical protein
MTTYKLMGHTITQGESFEKEVNRFGVTRMETAQWWHIFDPQGIKLDTRVSSLREAKEFVRRRKVVN